MDFSLRDVVLNFLLLEVTQGLLLFGYLRWQYRRPVRELRRLTAAMASGATPRSYFIDGPAWLEEVTRHLEKTGQEMERLQRLQRGENFSLNALLGSMVEGVMVVDSRHVVRLVNEELLNLFALKTSPLGRTVLESLRESSVELILRETMLYGEPRRREVTLESVQGDNAIRHFEVSALPIRERSGVIDGAVAVFHDITLLKQLEAVRQEFVANVSHELRTPLAIFRGYLETLLENPQFPPEEARRILETMRRHSNRLNALVEDLLSLTRLEAKNVELQLSTVHLGAFLRQIVQDWEKRFNAQPAQLRLELPADLPPTEIDTLRLEQVMFNLLENAVSYSNPPRQIVLAATLLENRVEIRVTDNGIGIPPGDLPHIFERFYRVDKGRSRISGGTGLGLSIVKHIIQLHHGTVHAESRLGTGTSIVLRLPLSQEEDQEPFPADQTEEKAA